VAGFVPLIAPSPSGSPAAATASVAAAPAPQDRTSRAAKSAAVALIQACASVALGLVSVPILVQALGQEAYGVWLLLGQIAAYLALVDFGNASVAKLQLASLHGPESAAKQRDVLTATLLGVLVTTPFVAAVGVAVAMLATMRFADGAISSASITATSGLLVASFLVYRLASIPAFVLFGANLEYRSALVRTLVTIGSAVLDLAVALAGLGMVGLACNRLVGHLLSGCILQITAQRDVPWYGIGPFHWSKLGPLFRQNSLCLFAQWGHTLAEAVDVLVIGLAVGPEAVPIYTITTSLPRLLFALFHQAMAGANAGLVGLFGSGNRERFHFVRTQQETISIACLAVVGAATLAVNREFVTAWVGSHYFGGVVLTMLGITWFFSAMMSRQYCNALNATLDFKHMAVVQVTAGVISVAAGFAGASIGGTVGAVAGLVVVRVAANAVNATRLDHLLGVPPWRHRSALLVPSIVAAACCFGGGAVSCAGLSRGWVGTVAVGAGVSLVASCAVWFLGMPQSSRADVAARLGNLRDSFVARTRSAAMRQGVRSS
jgi:O-antigen/teichoic acid export membrane protein